MKVGDMVQIKNPLDYDVGSYHDHLFDEIMLVTDIIDDLALDDDGFDRVAVDGVVVCISESGEQRFPSEDMEVIHESR